MVERKPNEFEEKVIKFEAHKDMLTTLSYIIMDKSYLLTSSMDCYIKIFVKESPYNIICSLNINHPLPLVWDLKID